VGSHGTILRTTDGGTTWVRQTSGTTASLLAVSFTDGNTGAVVGDAGKPWRHFEDVEFHTLEWVDWFNTRRLFEKIGHVPLHEFETSYYDQQEEDEVKKQRQQSVNRASGEAGVVQLFCILFL
jgi:hypothetical protein